MNNFKQNSNLCLLAISLLCMTSCGSNSSSNQSFPEVEAVPYLETEGGRYGFISTSSGEILCSDEIKVDALAGNLSPVVNGVFKVPTTDGYEYYTNTEKPEKISSGHYMRGGFYTESCIPVVTEQGKTISLIDIKGNEIAKLGEDIICVNSYFSDGLMLFKNSENKYGYIDNKGKIAIPVKFTYAQPFNEGIAVVSNSDADKTSKEFFIIGTKGETVTELKYDNLDMSVPMFFDGALVCGNRVIGKDGKLLFRTPSKWDYISQYNEGYASFREDDSFGVIDKKGEVVIRAKYDYPLTKMRNSFITIKNAPTSDEDYYYNIAFIDNAGEQINEIEKVSSHSILSDNLVAIYDGNGYYLCDGDGKPINNDEYSFIPSYSAMFNNNSTLAATFQPDGDDYIGIMLCDWIYNDYLPTDKIVADILSGMNSAGGFDNIKYGETLREVMKDHQFSALWRDYAYQTNYEFKNEVKHGINVSYGIIFNEYIANYSDYNYDAKVDGFFIIPDYTTAGNYTNISEKMYAAIVKNITANGFVAYANDVDIDGHKLNYFINQATPPYFVAIAQDASVIMIGEAD